MGPDTWRHTWWVWLHRHNSIAIDINAATYTKPYITNGLMVEGSACRRDSGKFREGGCWLVTEGSWW